MDAKTRFCGLHIKSVAYAATNLGSAMMHSVFMFYYVKIYLNRFHVSENWFHASQIVFMTWNALNDPLFGYIQDNFSFSWVRSRRHSIYYGAPLFVISFVIPWFPWGNYDEPTTLCGIQLMFSLCFYDTMFTFVLLAQCALFTEMSHLQEDRIRLVRYSQVASLIGSSSVFFTGLISDNLNDYGLFLLSTVVIAILSLLCMTYTGKKSYTQYDAKPESEPTNQNEELLGLIEKDEKSDKLTDNLTEKAPPEHTIWQQMWQISTQPSFISFVLMNFCQIYHSVYLSNFANIVCDMFIPNHILASSVRSTFYGALFITPQLLVILGTPIVTSSGYFKIIRLSFVLKIFMGLGLYIMGPTWWTLVIFFVVECAEVNATFSLFNLCLSDVIDVDKDKYHRKHPLSSMVFGTNALITKPAISLAPMITVAVLNRYGYEHLKTATNPDILASAEYLNLQNVMFHVTCATPVVTGVIQLLIWSFYTIRGSHLTISKYVEV